MLRDITIGQHFPGTSIVHRLDPRIKLLLTLGYIIVLFVGSNPLGLVLSTALFLDMGHPQASKGYAVEQLSAFYRVPRQNILAMGDSENDRSLFTAAGYGIAMKNSSEELQELADAVAESNDDDGVAQILEQLF